MRVMDQTLLKKKEVVLNLLMTRKQKPALNLPWSKKRWKRKKILRHLLRKPVVKSTTKQDSSDSSDSSYDEESDKATAKRAVPAVDVSQKRKAESDTNVGKEESMNKNMLKNFFVLILFMLFKQILISLVAFQKGTIFIKSHLVSEENSKNGRRLG